MKGFNAMKHKDQNYEARKFKRSRSRSICNSDWAHKFKACWCLAMRGNAGVVTHSLCSPVEFPPYTKKHALAPFSKGSRVDVVPQVFGEHTVREGCAVSCSSHWGWRTSRLCHTTGNELQSQVLEQTHCKWKLCRHWCKLLGITHTRYFSPSTPDSTLFQHY